MAYGQRAPTSSCCVTRLFRPSTRRDHKDAMTPRGGHVLGDGGTGTSVLSHGPPCDFGGCGGPQPPAGKQAARVPLRNSDLTSPVRADGRQRLGQPATSPAPRPMEAVRCIRLGELRGLVPIPYVALQDTRHGHPGGKPSRPPFDAARRRPGPRGGAEPGRANVHVMNLDRPDYYAPRTGQISREVAPYIIARGLGGVIQGSGTMGVDRPRRIDSP